MNLRVEAGEFSDFENKLSENLEYYSEGKMTQKPLEENSEYYLIAFTACWCPKCHAVSKTLQKLDELVKKRGQSLNVIYASKDRSARERIKGYRKKRYSFYSLPFNSKNWPEEIQKVDPEGKGIPSLVLLDANGIVLSNSYGGKKYIGPNKVINDLIRKLEV